MRSRVLLFLLVASIQAPSGTAQDNEPGRFNGATVQSGRWTAEQITAYRNAWIARENARRTHPTAYRKRVGAFWVFSDEALFSNDPEIKQVVAAEMRVIDLRGIALKNGIDPSTGEPYPPTLAGQLRAEREAGIRALKTGSSDPETPVTYAECLRLDERMRIISHGQIREADGQSSSANGRQETYRPEDYRAAVRKAAEVRSKHPQIQVFGKIEERNEDGSIFVFGHPQSCRVNVDPGCLNPYSGPYNMVVVDPSPEALRQFGGIQYAGIHAYLGKRTGKNAYGAGVPVYIYGTPEDVESADAEIVRLAALAKASGLDPASGEPVAVRAERDAVAARDAAELAEQRHQQWLRERASAKRFKIKGYLISCEGRFVDEGWSGKLVVVDGAGNQSEAYTKEKDSRVTLVYLPENISPADRAKQERDEYGHRVQPCMYATDMFHVVKVTVFRVGDVVYVEKLPRN